MRILHVVMDGFHPDNELKSLDLSDWILEKSGLKIKNKVTREVKSESKLMSPKMWCKLYSKNLFNDIKRYSPNEGIKHNTRIAKVYNEVPQNDWIWNKVAGLGVPSLVELSYGFEDIADNAKFTNGVYGVVNTLNSNRTYLVDGSNLHRQYISNGKYYGLHEVCDGLYKNAIINSKLTDLWNNYDNWKSDDVKEIIDLVNEGVTSEYMNHIDSNLNNYKSVRSVILDHMKSLSNIDNYYVTVSVLETDAIYHTCPPYQHIQDYLINYIKYKLSDILNSMKFDCIILTGDHGMVAAPGIRSKKVVYIDNGKEFRGEKSAYNNNIYFNDHSNTIGAWILSDHPIEIPSNSEYLSDDIYDYILENCTK